MSEKSLEELEFEETGVTRKERWKIMWASIIGYAMDGLDVLILSFAMAAIVSEFGLSLGEGGLIATYTLIGTVLGGLSFRHLCRLFWPGSHLFPDHHYFLHFHRCLCLCRQCDPSGYPPFPGRPWAGRGIRYRYDPCF